MRVGATGSLAARGDTNDEPETQDNKEGGVDVGGNAECNLPDLVLPSPTRRGLTADDISETC